MVFYSIKSNEKVFHQPHCIIRSRIQKANQRMFETHEIAREHGYRQCNCCSRVGMKLKKEQKEVNQFCQENGIAYHLEDGLLHIRTTNSKWCILTNGKAGHIFLYHKNTIHKDSKYPSILPGYHSQAVRSETILGYLKYIVGHDDFRVQEKKKEAQKRDFRRSAWKLQRDDSKRSYNAGQLYSLLQDTKF